MSKRIDSSLEDQDKTESEEKITLSKEEISEIQNRLRHYLNCYELETHKNATEVAKILGYTPMHYSRFKLVGTSNKLSSCLLFLSNLAHLKNLNLAEFVLYLENKPLKDAETQLMRSLWDWEIDTLSVFTRVESTLRRIFTRKTIKDLTSDNNIFKFEIALAALILLLRLNSNNFRLILNILKDLANRSENKFTTQYENEQDESEELVSQRVEMIKLLKKVTSDLENQKNNSKPSPQGDKNTHSLN